MIIAFPPEASAENKARIAIQTLQDTVASIDPTRHMSHAAQGLAAALSRSLDLASMLASRLAYLEQCRIHDAFPSPGANLTELATIASNLSAEVKRAEDWLSSKYAGPMPAVLQRNYHAKLRAQVSPAAQDEERINHTPAKEAHPMNRKENWKANGRVIWLVAAVAGLFAVQAVRVLCQSAARMKTLHRRGKARAAADVFRLHSKIEALSPRLATMSSRYALGKLATALANAQSLESALTERLNLSEVDRNGLWDNGRGVQMENIPGIVAEACAQLDQAVNYVDGHCRGQEPAIVSPDWFWQGRISGDEAFVLTRQQP